MNNTPFLYKLLPMTSIENRNSRAKRASHTLKVAITGGAGSGKTTVCNRLKELGFNVISTDALAKEVVSPGSPIYDAVVSHFGEQVVQPDGTLNRKRLRRIIIRDDTARRTLERFIHPEILKRMHQKVNDAENCGAPVVLVEVPLLFELGLSDRFDVVVMVAADRKRRIERLMTRDQVSRDDAEALLKAQLSDREKIKQSDFIIKNDGSISHMTHEVDDLYRTLREKISKTS